MAPAPRMPCKNVSYRRETDGKQSPRQQGQGRWFPPSGVCEVVPGDQLDEPVGHLPRAHVHGPRHHGLPQQLRDAARLSLRGVAEDDRLRDLVQRFHRHDLRVFRRAHRAILQERRPPPDACWDAAVCDARSDHVGAIADATHDLSDAVECCEFGGAGVRRQYNDRERSRPTDGCPARDRG